MGMARAAYRPGRRHQTTFEHHLEGAVMIAVLNWFYHRIGAVTLLQVTLLLFALGSVAFGLGGAVQNLDVTVLTWTSIAGVLFAWLAARSRLKARGAAVVLTTLSLLFLLLVQGRLGGPLAVLGLRFAQFSSAVERWLLVKNSPPPDPVLLSLAASDLQNQAAAVAGHFIGWLASFSGGHATHDTLVNSVFWGLLLWSASAWAAWQLRRYGRPLHSLLPATVLLAVVLNFTRSNPYLLLPDIITIFLLMIILGQLNRERRWEEKNIDYTTEIRNDVAMVAIPVMLAVLGVATLMPSISIRGAFELAHHIFEKPNLQFINLGQSLGLNQAEDNSFFSRSQTEPTLPQRHLIGTGPELSRRIVLQVTVKGISGQVDQGTNYYWRSFTYDRYTGAGWITSQTKVINYKAGDQPVSSSIPAHRLVEQEIHFVQPPNGSLYHTGSLVTADHDFQIGWRLPLESGPDLFGASLLERDYTVKSLTSVVSQEELRQASTNYPDWVKKRYLELPPEVPGRVSDLATELTKNLPSPYDKAVAIQDYLRTYSYTLDIPAPPTDRDIADYFLFDLKKGYCDYYATAMVVLAREAGIPARFVTGFAHGVFNQDQNQYIVTEADAHSWVEVYFPAYGWVEFEPTASRQVIQLPVYRPTGEKPSATGKPPVILWLARLNPSVPWIAGGLFLVLLLAGAGWQAGSAYRLSRYSPARAAIEVYRSLRRRSRQLNSQLPPGETPFELSRSLVRRLRSMEKSKVLAALLKTAEKDSDRIVNLYALAEYSQHPLREHEKTEAIRAWQRLSWRLRLAELWGRIIKRAGVKSS